MRLLLQHRILLGYIILIAVIGSMAATMLHERSRVHKIEEEITEIREANQTINAAHRHITILATLGNLPLHGMMEISKSISCGGKKSIASCCFYRGIMRNLLRPIQSTPSALYWRTRKNTCSIRCMHSNGRTVCYRNRNRPLPNRQKTSVL